MELPLWNAQMNVVWVIPQILRTQARKRVAKLALDVPLIVTRCRPLMFPGRGKIL